MNSYSNDTSSSGRFLFACNAAGLSVRKLTLMRGLLIASIATISLLTVNSSALAQADLTAGAASKGLVVNEEGYKVRAANKSEFNNDSEFFVKDWRQADAEYEDTVFGEQLYNEPSTPTKLEMLRLISKDTPSSMVFLHAVAMGLDLGEVLQAAVQYEPSKSRELASSAVSILPVMTQSTAYLYSSYEIDDLERENEADPYSVKQVADRFFKDRRVLRPYPDWFDGQYHFLASAAELKALREPQKDLRWYRSSSAITHDKRPVFVSLYEGTGSMLIDSEERIDLALKDNPDARLPVVFIFNRLNERSIDELAYQDEQDDNKKKLYPRTIRGVQQAYGEKNLMVTPTPEWQLGEYHLTAEISEFDEIFNLPEEDDFEPEAWQKLIAEAQKYKVDNASFLFVVLGDQNDNRDNARVINTFDELYAAWYDPRTEEQFKYVQPQDGESATLKNLAAKGLIFNRPDLIAALKSLGVAKVPVAFYYIDSSRVIPYVKGPRSLIQAAIGAGAPPGSFGGGGFLPPPIEVPPPASPPGIQ